MKECEWIRSSKCWHIRAKLIYLVPDFHNPKGTTLAIERREHLIDFSRRYRFRFSKTTPTASSIQGHKARRLRRWIKTGLVIHLSTFSKTLSPGIRIGWVRHQKNIPGRLSSPSRQPTFTPARLSSTLLRDFFKPSIMTPTWRRFVKCTASGARPCSGDRKAFPIGNSNWTRPEGGFFIWVELPKKSAEKKCSKTRYKRVWLSFRALHFLPTSCNKFHPA